MKILIISLPRSGSTSLMNKIANEKKLKPVFEPFDITHEIPRKNFGSNFVLKTIINQYPKTIKNPINWYENLSKNFDETILLSRRDLKACAESLAYYNYFKNQGFETNQTYVWEETPNFETSFKYINGCNDKIQKLSQLINVPIVYYEDLYDVNSNKRLRVGNRNNIKSTLI